MNHLVKGKSERTACGRPVKKGRARPDADLCKTCLRAAKAARAWWWEPLANEPGGNG